MNDMQPDHPFPFCFFMFYMKTNERKKHEKGAQALAKVKGIDGIWSVFQN